MSSYGTIGRPTDKQIRETGRECGPGGATRPEPEATSKILLSRFSAWEPDDEFYKFARLSLYVDPSAMPFDNNVMGYRKSEPRSFTRRLCGEKGIEQFLSHLGRDAGTVFANADFDSLAESPGRSAKQGLKAFVICLDFAQSGGIEAVGNQV